MATLADDLALYHNDESLLSLIAELPSDPNYALAQQLVANDAHLLTEDINALLTGLPCDSSCSSSASPPTTPETCSPTDMSTTESMGEADAYAEPMRRRSKREQLLDLRSTVKELESQLEALRESRKDPTDDLWESILKTQRKERQHSEAENARLREMLNDQAFTAQNLGQALFRKRTSREDDDGLSDSGMAADKTATNKRAKAHKGISHLEDPAIETQLLSIAHSIYLDVDQILETPLLKSSKAERRRVSEIRNDQKTGMTVMEGVDTVVYPFEYRGVADVLWDVATDVVDSSMALLQERIDHTQGIFTRFYEQAVDLDTWRGRFRVKVVVRRYIEENRIVQITCTLMDPVELDGHPVSGLCNRRRLMDIIEPDPSGRRGTLKTSHIIVEPGVYDPELTAEERERGIEMLTRYAMIQGRSKCGPKQQTLENRLIDALGKLSVQEDKE